MVVAASAGVPKPLLELAATNIEALDFGWLRLGVVKALAAGQFCECSRQQGRLKWHEGAWRGDLYTGSGHFVGAD